jgi:hypothetical protein
VRGGIFAPGRCGEPTTQVLGLSKPQDGIQDRHSVGGHGQSNDTTAAGEMGQDVDGACPAFGGAGPQTAILG